jgi:hypothetical protein
MQRSSSGTLSVASTATPLPFLNSESIGNLTRSYLTMAVRLKIERHGSMAKEIAQLDSDAKRLDALVRLLFYCLMCML